jgi:elongation factor P
VAISINEIANGIGLRINDAIYVVTDYDHVKPGKGSAFVRVRMKNLKTDQVLERTFRSAETLEEAQLEERSLQNLYQSSDGYHFMDHTTYEEVVISQEVLGDAVRFLQENLEVTGVFYNDKILKVQLPTFIISEVLESEPGFKGDSTKAGTKPAKIDTGTTIQVPLFINVGDRIKIDTRTGIYVERVQK